MQIRLANLLKKLKIKRDSAISIALKLQDDYQIINFGKWIKQNMKATESQILEQAVKISEENHCLINDSQDNAEILNDSKSCDENYLLVHLGNGILTEMTESEYNDYMKRKEAIEKLKAEFISNSSNDEK